MLVRLLVDWADGKSPAGAVVDLEPATARQLLNADAAEPVWYQPEQASVAPARTATLKRPKPRKRK